MTPTRYRIVPRDPHAHRFEVDCTIDDPAPDGQRFALPTWIPGSYLIREFARNVVAVRARRGRPRRRRSPRTARTAGARRPCAGPLTVHDRRLRVRPVGAHRLPRRDARLLQRHQRVPAARGPRRTRPAPSTSSRRPRRPAAAGASRRRSRATAPRPGASAATARATTTSSSTTRSRWRDFAHVALRGRRRDARRRRHRSRARSTRRGSPRDLARVCQWQVDFFGGAHASRAPFDRYLFQVTAVGDGYGGLEHRASTSLLCSRRDLPATGRDRDRRRLPHRSSASRATSTSTPGTSSASSRPRSCPTTSRARPTRGCCGRSRASRRTTTTWRWCAAA